jgi:FlaA1/EpsC-like NDP-sugar epimerase
MSSVPSNLYAPKGAPFLKSRILSKQAQFALDLLVLFIAFLFAYLLRFDFSIPHEGLIQCLNQLPLVLLCQFSVLYLAGIYKFIWRYVGLAETKKIINAALWAALPLLLLRIWLPDSLQEWRVPISVILIDNILAFGGIVLLRVARRDVYERKQRKATQLNAIKRRPILLIGAGRAGMLTAAEIRGRGDVDLEIKGFIDDDSAKRGSVIQGVKVLGSTQDLPHLVRELNIDHVVISIAQASRQDFRRILDICNKIPIKARVIPGLYEILQDKLKISRIRDVEIEDLLGREQVQLDEKSLHNLLTGKTIVVTGAGGSIGSELARQAAQFNPAQLLLIERAECALFNIDREIRSSFPELSIYPLVGDIGDEARMRSIFSYYRPQVILHAAAHKHVPMMESNTVEAVKNNVLGTYTLGVLAGEFNVEAFVLISTDKAVRPTSVMGATKRIAELIVQDLNRSYQTRYVAVRFGNVIGSAGSVIPIFREQILKGGPVTVTDPNMVRYFMTIPEASQLVLQAGAIGQGGEIFVLDMGEPVRILDLAKQTIRLSGLQPYEDIDIVFTGVRPGEKLFEELEVNGEELTKTLHPKIFIGQIANYPPELMREALEKLRVLTKSGWGQELRRTMHDFLPESQLEVESSPLTAEEEIPIALAVSNS